MSQVSDSSTISELDFEASGDEITALEKAIKITQDINDDLQSTLDLVMQLSSKYGAPLLSSSSPSTPGTRFKSSDCLATSSVDSLINERRQKHDFCSPQQHHKMQEINDSSCFSPSQSIINHPAKVSVDSEVQIDEMAAGGDNKSADDTIRYESQEFGDFRNRYVKVNIEKIKFKYGIKSALKGVEQAIDKLQPTGSSFHYFKLSKKSPIKGVKFSPSHESTPQRPISSVEGSVRLNKDIKPRPASSCIF